MINLTLSEWSALRTIHKLGLTKVVKEGAGRCLFHFSMRRPQETEQRKAGRIDLIAYDVWLRSTLQIVGDEFLAMALRGDLNNDLISAGALVRARLDCDAMTLAGSISEKLELAPAAADSTEMQADLRLENPGGAELLMALGECFGHFGAELSGTHIRQANVLLHKVEALMDPDVTQEAVFSAVNNFQREMVRLAGASL